MGDAEKLGSLTARGYLRGNKWAECPASRDASYDDYDIIMENGIVSDVECKVRPSEHKWP